MDATKRPLLIPPEFATYAEKHGIFEMYTKLLEQLLINKPDDPLTFLIELLKRDSDDAPQVVIMGPPAAGKRTIAKMVCNRIRAAYLTMDNLIQEAEIEIRKKAQEYIKKNETIPTELWLKIIKERMKSYDCIKRGWVLEGFPQTREQALALQAEGIYPKHFVLLDAPDTVLIERAAGKRVDPETGDVYHTTFDWPSNAEVAGRLEPVPGNSEDELVNKLVVYHRHIEGLKTCYSKILKIINADQPKGDVFAQTITFLGSRLRNAAPHNPRVVLLGPTGSGKGVQAALLANKYNIVNISCGQLIKQAIVDETKAGLAAKPYLEKNMLVPDAILLNILKQRLGQLDCVSRGWVMHGYPKTTEQGEQLVHAGFTPNRVFFLDVPNDSVIERLTLRATDPITGERYHMLYNPPRTQEVKERLRRAPKDSPEEVQKRLGAYQAFVDELTDYYVDAQHVNADQDPHTVFECLESMMVNPIPQRFDD
ncbi:adenylate kinase 8-like [Lingula anatina]|uniref:Adenylate kinase 8-like n=1 Tax=Lingula anatina TaxID=7574 RepID=A0A1S3K5Z5_LINAN|nr:adenylate kinase 8-like [Lingula anatina]|eukprot:XP_013418058.1 adenylate kinase 8-like [Lingula anatina]